MSNEHLKMRLSFAALQVIVAVAIPGTLQAQDAHELVRKSSVYIQMTGQSSTGLPVGSQGTGFFVDKDGLILTSYHLIEHLQEQKAIPATVEIKVSVGNTITPSIPAQIVDSKASVDLLLLKIAPADHPTTLEPLQLGSISDIPTETTVKVLTSGFRNKANQTRVALEAQIIGRTGPGGYTWILDKQVEGGQSGSPVYIRDKDGAVKVVGLIKGVSGPEEGVFVPISHAESLLLPIRLREIRNQIDSLSASVVQSQIDLASEKYLKSERGSALLSAWFKDYVKALVEAEVDQILDAHQKKIENRLDRYMDKVVAYSYSAEFSFTGKPDEKQKSYYVLPFYKTSSDTGDVQCDFTYQNTKIKNAVFYRFNDSQPGEVKPDPKGEARMKKRLPKDNRSMFDGMLPTDPEPSARQQIMFWVDDQKEFDGRITALCTILVIGSAKLTGQ